MFISAFTLLTIALITSALGVLVDSANAAAILSWSFFALLAVTGGTVIVYAAIADGAD